jgi:hypothetical protein
LLHHAISYYSNETMVTTRNSFVSHHYNNNNHSYGVGSSNDIDDDITYCHQHPTSYLSSSCRGISALQEELFDIIMTLNPNACMVQDHEGNLPIHVLLSSSIYDEYDNDRRHQRLRRNNSRPTCRNMMAPRTRYWLLQQLLRIYPSSVTISNRYDEMPLHLALQQPHHNIPILKLLIPLTASGITMMTNTTKNDTDHGDEQIKPHQQQPQSSTALLPPDLYLPTLSSQEDLCHHQPYYMEMFLMIAIQNNAPRSCIRLLIQWFFSPTTKSLSYTDDNPMNTSLDFEIQQPPSAVRRRHDNNCLYSCRESHGVTTAITVGYQPFITALRYQLSFRKLMLLLHAFPDVISIPTADTHETALHIASYSYENSSDNEHANQYRHIIQYFVHLYPPALMEQNIYNQIPLHCALSYAKDTIDLNVIKVLTKNQNISSSPPASQSFASIQDIDDQTNLEEVRGYNTDATILDATTASYNNVSSCYPGQPQQQDSIVLSPSLSKTTVSEPPYNEVDYTLRNQTNVLLDWHHLPQQEEAQIPMMEQNEAQIPTNRTIYGGKKWYRDASFGLYGGE